MDKTPDSALEKEKNEEDSLHAVHFPLNIRRTGHVARVDNNRHPKQTVFSQLSDGTRNRDRPHFLCISNIVSMFVMKRN